MFKTLTKKMNLDINWNITLISDLKLLVLRSQVPVHIRQIMRTLLNISKNDISLGRYVNSYLTTKIN